ncbi:MAG: trigger factor [Candidatus Staskawiczbacteria bacterium]|jgi:trigger factor
MKNTLKKLPKSQVEIEFEVPTEDLAKCLDKATAHAAEHLHIDGFRKGNAPRNVVEEKAGKETLLAEAADLAAKDAYTEAIKEHKLEPISSPEIEVLKLAPGNPFLFKLKVFVMPEVELADYKKFAQQIKKNEVSITEEDMADTFAYLRKSRAKFSQLSRPAQEKDFVMIEYESPELSGAISTPDAKKPIKDEFILGEGGMVPGFEKNLIGMSADEEKSFFIIFPKESSRKDLAGKEVNFKVKMLSVQQVELPEVDDNFAKSLGNFENLVALEKNIKDGMKMEKEGQERERQRNEVIEKVAERSKLEIPDFLIDMEKDRLFNNFQDKISQNFKMTFEEYLSSIKQDEKTIKESFQKEAEKKVRNFLVLREIGQKENVSVEEKEVEEEANRILKKYPAETAKKIDINQLKEYARGVVYNEKVFEKLESFSRNEN